MDHQGTRHSAPTIGLDTIAAMTTGAVWALVLGVLGLWCVFSEPLRASVPGLTRLAAGVSLLCGAQYLFLTIVADRVFRAAPRRITRGSETSLLVLTGLGSCVLLVSLISGGAP